MRHHNKTIPTIVLLLTALLSSYDRERQNRFSDLSGPFLGQPTPSTIPVLFAPGIISTGLEENLCTFTPDNREMIFLISYSKPHSRHMFSVLLRTRQIDGKWSYPQVMDFSGNKTNSLYPFIRYDGKELLFQSDLPTGNPNFKDKYNIWMCRRDGDEWSTPKLLPAPVNGNGDVSGPSMSLDGDFFFTLMSGIPEKDGIYQCRHRNGAYSTPQRLPDSVNVQEGSFDGVVSPDGRYYLVNVYNRRDSLGGTDLYVSFREPEGHWTPLRNLGSNVNGPHNEGSARISADGRYIFFSSYHGEHRFFDERLSYDDILDQRLKPQCGNSDIYWFASEYIETLRNERE